MIAAPLRWVQDELPKFLRFCAHVRVATKELGVVRLDQLLSSQLWFINEIFRGLDEGLHDFLCLKGRQLGISTILWALDLWWWQRFEAMQAMYITDDGENTQVHRAIIMEMYGSIPARFTRGKIDIGNRALLEWQDQPARAVKGRVRPPWHTTRVMWAHGHAQGEGEGQLGRSRGINYIHAEELDGWTDDPKSLVLATDHPHRLYLWVGTGQGYGLLYEMWEQAQKALTRRPLFIGWWRLDTNRLDPNDPEKAKLWRAYGRPRITPEERDWIKEVKRQFDAEVTIEQLAWWRMTMAEAPNIKGDQATMLQEHPWFPEHAFQSAGSRFLSPSRMLTLHRATRDAPKPDHYDYEWGATFDEKGDDALIAARPEDAQLTIWEDAVPGGLYVVAGDPAYGSSEKADAFAATVWRCWPDRLIQVAEFHTHSFAMYQFAWVLAHLSGTYPRWLIYELTGPGQAVQEQFRLMEEFGFGFTRRGGDVRRVVGNIEGYMQRRKDTFTGSVAPQFKMTAERREIIMTQLHDVCERGMLTVRSVKLWGEIGALRREGTRIEAGGVAHDDLAITAALAVEHWMAWIIEELQGVIPDSDATPTAKTDPTQRAVRSFLRRVTSGPGEEPKKLYGVRTLAPGR